MGGFLSSVEDFISAVESDPSVRRRLAAAILTDSDARLAIIGAVLRDVATRKDIDDLRGDVDKKVESLRT
ncbi:MAG: hypothetical protein QXE01_00275 [Sulfolobales archaeon]